MHAVFERGLGYEDASSCVSYKRNKKPSFANIVLSLLWTSAARSVIHTWCMPKGLKYADMQGGAWSEGGNGTRVLLGQWENGDLV